MDVLIPYLVHSMVFVNQIYDMVVNTQSLKFYGRRFARVLYSIYMKYM